MKSITVDLYADVLDPVGIPVTGDNKAPVKAIDLIIKALTSTFPENVETKSSVQICDLYKRVYSFMGSKTASDKAILDISEAEVQVLTFCGSNVFGSAPILMASYLGMFSVKEAPVAGKPNKKLKRVR